MAAARASFSATKACIAASHSDAKTYSSARLANSSSGGSVVSGGTPAGAPPKRWASSGNSERQVTPAPAPPSTPGTPPPQHRSAAPPCARLQAFRRCGCRAEMPPTCVAMALCQTGAMPSGAASSSPRLPIRKVSAGPRAAAASSTCSAKPPTKPCSALNTMRATPAPPAPRRASSSRPAATLARSPALPHPHRREIPAAAPCSVAHAPRQCRASRRSPRPVAAPRGCGRETAARSSAIGSLTRLRQQRHDRRAQRRGVGVSHSAVMLDHRHRRARAS